MVILSIEASKSFFVRLLTKPGVAPEGLRELPQFSEEVEPEAVSMRSRDLPPVPPHEGA